MRQSLQACHGYFTNAATFSLAINLLYLAGPLYMLQVYDRVISSASEITLLMLTLALLLAFMALAGLDAVRARVLTRTSIRLDRKIAPAGDDRHHRPFGKIRWRPQPAAARF
ncbi:ABC-type protease/lipase transport system fused ATPase/permease subunit [Bradyrhizobium sp. JR6.1]